MRLGESLRVGFGQKPALIVVDMARSLTDPSSPFYLEQARTCLDHLLPLVAAARAAQLPIVFTKGGLRYYTSKVQVMNDAVRGAWTFKNACHDSVDDPSLWEIAPEFEVAPDEIVIEKTKPSGFFGTPLASYLNYHGVDTVIACGMMTSDCLRSTIVDAFQYNYRVIVPLEGAADRRLEAHAPNLEDIDLKYGDVMPMADVLAHLHNLRSASA